MNVERMKLWIAALRSGEYQQTVGSLQDSKGFCCLGVMCDVFHKQTALGGWEGNFKSADHMRFFIDDLYNGGTPPTIVLDWFGFWDVGNPQEWNDVDVLTFEQIASSLEDIVEAYERGDYIPEGYGKE